MRLFKRLQKCFSFKFSIILGTFATLILLYPVAAVADTLPDDKVKAILNQYPLESNGILPNIMRQLGWSVVLFLHWIVGGLEDVIYGINDAIGGFFTSNGVTDLENKVLPIAVALIGVVVVVLGIQTIIKPQKFTPIVSNFIVGIVITIALPSLLSTAYTFTNQAISYIDSDSNGKMQTMSDRILVDNITDVTRYDTNGFKSTTLNYKNYYAMPKSDLSQITKINATELVTPDNMTHKEVWSKKVSTDTNGTQTLQDLGTGQFGVVNLPIFSEYYYRWNIDWLSILSTLIVTGVALIFSSIKISRLIFELAINQTMTQVMALLDVFTAQRLKKCIQMLISTLGTLFAVFYMLQIYILGMSYISKVSNIFLRLILMVSLAWAEIDGPNLFEQILGVDAGLHNATRTLFGLKAASSMLAGGIALAGGRGAIDALKTKGVFGAARGLVGKAGSAAGKMSGMAAGTISGAAENRQRVAAIRQGQSDPAAAKKSGSEQSGQQDKGTQINSPADVSNQATPDSPSSVPENSSAPSLNNNNINGTAENTNKSDSISSLQQRSGQRVPGQGSNPGKQIAESPVAAATIGGAVRSGIKNRINGSGTVNSARRMYNLTRGTMQAHGDKKVAREEKVQAKMQGNNDLSHHQAVRQVKKEDNNEKWQNRVSLAPLKNDGHSYDIGASQEKSFPTQHITESQNNQSWAEQEINAERNQIKGVENKK
ncbi:MAG TPA: hypothetical protein VHP31_09575 [Caproicibacter sp.]|nr:hypothetical protein [Caproicibacter sp.]